MTTIAPLSASYREARAAFLAAATAAGARVTTTVHPLLGVEGEELAVDIAELGPADAEHVVIVVSGTHGVEGYAGSALQRFVRGTRAGRSSRARLRLVSSRCGSKANGCGQAQANGADSANGAED